MSATDAQGDSYRIVVDGTDGGSGDRTLVLAAFGAKALTTADHITLTWPSSAEHHAAVDAFSGVAAADPFATATGAAGTAFNSGSTATTATANELVCGGVGAEGGASPVFAAGYTALPVPAVSSDRLATGYLIVNHTGMFASSGSVTGQWTSDVVTLR